MKLPVASTIVSRGRETVFQFLCDPKYLNIYPKVSGFKLVRLDHLNSLPYGLGKKLRISIRRHNKEITVDIDVYKFKPPNELGYKLTNVFDRKMRKLNKGPEDFLPEFAVDLILEDMSSKTKLKYVCHVTNVNSMFVRVLMYITFGIFGYYRNRSYVKELGRLIERFV